MKYTEIEPKREFEINGIIKPYDACSIDAALEEAKRAYKHMTYIGSSTRMYINGKLNAWDNEVHFFKF